MSGQTAQRHGFRVSLPGQIGIDWNCIQHLSRQDKFTVVLSDQFLLYVHRQSPDFLCPTSIREVPRKAGGKMQVPVPLRFIYAFSANFAACWPYSYSRPKEDLCRSSTLSSASRSQPQKSALSISVPSPEFPSSAWTPSAPLPMVPRPLSPFSFPLASPASTTSYPSAWPSFPCWPSSSPLTCRPSTPTPT